MNPMDRVTLHGLFLWAVFIAGPLAAAAWVRRELRQRREDKQWASGVAHAMKRRGPRTFLSDEEEAEFARIVAHYNDVPLDEILDSEGEDLLCGGFDVSAPTAWSGSSLTSTRR